METEALDDALTVFAATAPDYGSIGLANHGPMVAEALAHLGRADAIAGWVARYRTRLDDAPLPARPLTEEDWPAALGQEGRFPEWLALFEREIADRPPPPWWGSGRRGCFPARSVRPPTGSSAPGTRCAALAAADTPPRRLEVANGLAFWASSYEELPGPPLLIGHEGVAQALADLPVSPGGRAAPGAHQRPGGGRGRHRRRVRAGGGVARLDGRRGGPARPACRGRVAGLPAQRRRRRGDRPAARGDVAPGLRAGAALAGEEDRDAALGYVWQAAAALHVAYDDRPGHAGTRRRRPRLPTPWSMRLWTRATSTPSS